jgi:hypothetical protein
MVTIMQGDNATVGLDQMWCGAGKSLSRCPRLWMPLCQTEYNMIYLASESPHSRTIIFVSTYVSTAVRSFRYCSI